MLAKIALLAAIVGGSTLLSAAPPVPRQAAKKSDGPNGRFDIDTVHSSVVFKIKHMGVANFYGRFNKVGGKLLVDGDNPAESVINVSIDVKSIDTNNADRDKHVLSDALLNGAEFPEITFESEKVAPKGGNKLEVTGKFKMHGVEKTIVVPVEQTGFGDLGPRMGTVVGYEARFTVKRSEFKMGAMPEALGDDIEIVISLEAARR